MSLVFMAVGWHLALVKLDFGLDYFWMSDSSVSGFYLPPLCK
jgi:hypothetical protein